METIELEVDGQISRRGEVVRGLERWNVEQLKIGRKSFETQEEGGCEVLKYFYSE